MKAPAKAKAPTVVRKAKVVTKSDDKETSLATAEAFMQSAAASALAGIRLGHGGPFGATIVRDGVIIAAAHNMVLHRKDPTGHAEMNAIQQACQALGSHDLSDCELFTTCEPCPMCWGAVQWARLCKVHIGVDRHTAAKYGFDDKACFTPPPHKAFILNTGEFRVLPTAVGWQLRYGQFQFGRGAEPGPRQRGPPLQGQLSNGSHSWALTARRSGSGRSGAFVAARAATIGVSARISAGEGFPATVAARTATSIASKVVNTTAASGGTAGAAHVAAAVNA
ncbi:unnamed protein product [Polarella glacialis]|uniref:CMP/dCMP-type deaminase domain-containing protein n=1 Tax=Polarella glacialis TaxID=89957 RepID=A0A813G182_POLGL|nr:unnamed protein product [Polarella glacialis]